MRFEVICFNISICIINLNKIKNLKNILYFKVFFVGENFVKSYFVRILIC